MNEGIYMNRSMAARGNGAVFAGVGVGVGGEGRRGFGGGGGIRGWAAWGALLAVISMVAACCPSVNPFYRAKDVVFDPTLVGVWQPKEADGEGESWKFAQEEGGGYVLTVTEEGGKEGTFEAKLFELEGKRFLDLLPKECGFAKEQAGLVSCAMVPGHLLVREERAEPELRLAFFDVDWLEEHLEANPGVLAHRESGGKLVLTASTRALQRFVLKHLGEKELFGDYGVLVRKAGGG